MQLLRTTRHVVQGQEIDELRENLFRFTIVMKGKVSWTCYQVLAGQRVPRALVAIDDAIDVATNWGKKNSKELTIGS